MRLLLPFWKVYEYRFPCYTVHTNEIETTLSRRHIVQKGTFPFLKAICRTEEEIIVCLYTHTQKKTSKQTKKKSQTEFHMHSSGIKDMCHGTQLYALILKKGATGAQDTVKRAILKARTNHTTYSLPSTPLWPWLVYFPALKTSVWRTKPNPVLILRITLKPIIETEKLWTSSWSSVFWAVWVFVAEFWGLPYLCDEFGQLLIAGGGGELCNLYSEQHLEKTRAGFHTENELAPWCFSRVYPTWAIASGNQCASSSYDTDRSVNICTLVYFINQIKRLVVGKKMREDKMRGVEGNVFLWSPMRRSEGKVQTGDSLVALLSLQNY